MASTTFLFNNFFGKTIMESQNSVIGIKRVDLIKALWESSQPSQFYSDMKLTPPPFDDVKATAEIVIQNPHNRNVLISGKLYVDYICGRAIKIDINEIGVCDCSRYDSRFGKGASLKVINNMLRNFNKT